MTDSVKKEPGVLRRIAVTSLISTVAFSGVLPPAGATQNPFGINPGILGAAADSINGGCGTESTSEASLASNGVANPNKLDPNKLKEEQTKNATDIIEEGKSRGLPKRAVTIALATALVEAEMVNVNYGDDIHGVTNPDGTLTSSLGLFQQQKWWGSKEDRLNPRKAAGFFYDALVKFDYQSMEPGSAAQRVQGSAFPSKYATRMGEAEAIFDKITGGKYEPAKTEKKDDAKDSKSSDSSGDSASDSSSSDSCPGGSGEESGKGGSYGKAKGKGGKGDDYPLHADAGSIAAGFDPDLDPWGLFVGQCVSWAAWRVNKQMGWDGKGDPPFTMAKMGMAGRGNGYQWSSGLAAKGYKTDMNPKKGAVAWWNSNVGPTAENGHVAIVEDYDLKGKRVYVSQYNAWPKPLEYSEAWYDFDQLSGFIHVADTE